MIVKVDWFPRPSTLGRVPPRMSHTYEATDYFAEYCWDKDTQTEQRQYPTLRLMLNSNGSAHDLYLSDGDTAYIMNDSGKTIEILRTHSKDSL